MIKPPSAMIAALLFAGITTGFLAASTAAYAQTAAPASGDVKTELTDLVQKVQAKINGGKKTEADFTDELKQFDTILNEHKGEKTDDVAQVLLMKAQLYSEVFADNTKALVLIKQLKNDFPDTKAGMNADRISAMMIRQEESQKIQRALANGSAFPDFDEKDIDGKPVSVANYKGKVVLVDFWATWCGPCVGEMPNVISAYQKYHDKGFEIIGISLDQDKDSLTNFIKEKNMTWQQYFDGQGWQNKLAVKYGINSIPANYLIGKDGKIIDKELRGQALDDAVAKALGQ
jgi:peroxiredoxin